MNWPTWALIKVHLQDGTWKPLYLHPRTMLMAQYATGAFRSGVLVGAVKGEEA